MQQLNSLCQQNYGFGIDNWKSNREGYSMGYFSVTVPAGSSLPQIAAIFNQRVSENKVKTFPQAPGYRFEAATVHIQGADVQSNLPKAERYDFLLAGNRIPN